LSIFDVAGDGSRKLVDHGMSDGELFASAGDEYETVTWFLQTAADAQENSVVVEGSELLLWAKPTDLSTRLQSLVADVRRAGEYSVVDMAGQQMVRLKFEDGSTRMSAVSDDELVELEELGPW